MLPGPVAISSRRRGRESGGAAGAGLLIRAACNLGEQVMAEHQESGDTSLVWVTAGILVFGAVIIYILSQLLGG